MRHTKFSDRFVKVEGQRELAPNPLFQERPWTYHSYTTEVGRTHATIVCPFCAGETVAFMWSLPNGKRCNHCPALFGRVMAYCLKEPTP